MSFIYKESQDPAKEINTASLKCNPGAEALKEADYLQLETAGSTEECKKVEAKKDQTSVEMQQLNKAR